MLKNPYVNAIAAGAYIVILVLLMSTFVDGPAEERAGILVPITMISLFVLSASVMGYLFILQPVMLYFDGKKKEAVDFFVRTVATFAVIAIALVITLSSIS